MAKTTVKASFIAYGFKWLVLILIVGVAAGTLSALFLAALNLVTIFRDNHTWMLYLLPFAGLVIGFVYHHKGKEVERGNNIIFDTVHNPAAIIPFKMVPLVLTGTVVTHLFGGSAGREGTALQMAAATADQLHKPFKLNAAERTILLIAGLSAGFASVFGTPLAGIVFGIEVLLLGKIPVKAILPAIATAFIGAYVTELWGVGHTHYSIALILPLTFRGIAYSVIAGLAFGLAAIAFVKLTEGFSHGFKKISYPPLRPFAGGVLVLLLFLLPGTYKFAGLGIPAILDSFNTASQGSDFALKILFTAITLGSGFKGGEVTPLFFIGATLGSALSVFLPLPVGLLAGMGFVAVFAGAAKTPLACCLMAMELFGLSCGIYVAIACTVSFFISGRHSIYNAPENKTPRHFLFGKIRNLFF
ncbi:H+/Cl- antiporter ClcA [Pedobacter sp. AK017]|uniref:chloride channel protein n=1 Tax=Pedobacter sp. AK017 TaxID=2723073 RepID=UPI00160788DF|nr:chloride channel protein [Pedobacter sp. AK017]MBB5440017.1 H+/Cl- antiporter ClcA [Pedobacter sp. AK017]